MLGVTSRTIRNWDYTGKIKVSRTVTGYRIIPLSEIERIQNNRPLSNKVTIAYCRVSTRKQNDNLERQVGRVLSHCSEMKWTTELYKDIGSGLNDKRKEFKKIINRISKGDVERVVVEFKDRITRFGFETFSEYCSVFGVSVEVLSEAKTKEFEKEFSEDVIALVTSYAARLHGRRGGKKSA